MTISQRSGTPTAGAGAHAEDHAVAGTSARVAAGATRTRTYTWQDPLAPGPVSAAPADGLAALQGLIADGNPPPIARTLDFTLTEVERGRAVFTVVPGEHHYNPIGSVHGGLAATLCDSACGCAVQSTLPAGAAYTTMDLTIKMLRGITVDTGTLFCEGTIIHAGRRTALAEARLTDTAGKLYAFATSTCMIFPAGG